MLKCSIRIIVFKMGLPDQQTKQVLGPHSKQLKTSFNAAVSHDLIGKIEVGSIQEREITWEESQAEEESCNIVRKNHHMSRS